MSAIAECPGAHATWRAPIDPNGSGNDFTFFAISPVLARILIQCIEMKFSVICSLQSGMNFRDELLEKNVKNQSKVVHYDGNHDMGPYPP